MFRKKFTWVGEQAKSSGRGGKKFDETISQNHFTSLPWYLLINPADRSTLFPADPFVITRIQIACVDENGPVVVMSGVLRFEIFRMTRSITHVIKFSMKQTFSGQLGKSSCSGSRREWSRSFNTSAGTLMASTIAGKISLTPRFARRCSYL